MLADKRRSTHATTYDSSSGSQTTDLSGLLAYGLEEQLSGKITPSLLGAAPKSTCVTGAQPFQLIMSPYGELRAFPTHVSERDLVWK